MTISFNNINFPPYNSTVNGYLKLGEYNTGDTAIQVFYDDGELYSVPTVNLAAYGIMPGEGRVIIADYSEHKGVWKALHEIGVISEPINTIPFGPFDAQAVLCDLIINN